MYPYGYMSSIENFHEGELPPKEEFYSKLNDCDITDEDYEHAEKVYKEFDMKTMGDYHNYFLKTDVICLHTCLKNSETFVTRIISSNLPGITLLLDWLGLVH